MCTYEDSTFSSRKTVCARHVVKKRIHRGSYHEGVAPFEYNSSTRANEQCRPIESTNLRMLHGTANNRKCMTGHSDRPGPGIVAANERSVLATEMQSNL